MRKKWVVGPNKPNDLRYQYGFVYMDPTAGFTLHLEGSFIVDKDNHYIDSQSVKPKTSMQLIRLGPNTVKLALLPPSHFAELRINAEPDWLKIYYRPYIDTVAHNYHTGFNYNAAGDGATALNYLLPVYKAKPDYPGLGYELAFAYNDIGQMDKATEVVTLAMKRDPKNPRFFRKLGYSAMKKNDTGQAINYYKQGIDLAARNEDKSEMSYNLAMIYRGMNSQDEFKNWMTKAKNWAEPNSQVYQNAVRLGF